MVIVFESIQFEELQEVLDVEEACVLVVMRIIQSVDFAANFTVNVPEVANEETQIEDQNYELQDLENKMDLETLFDVVMVLVDVVLQGWVCFYFSVQVPVEELVNRLHELSWIETFDALQDTQRLYEIEVFYPGLIMQENQSYWQQAESVETEPALKISHHDFLDALDRNDFTIRRVGRQEVPRQ